MKDFEKLVRQGLDRQDRSAVEDHPDAGLLTSFVERSVTESERRGILRHLAICALCRQIVAFAMPEADAAAPVLQSTEVPLWRRWLVVRWAALSAMVIVAAGAVTLYRSNQPQPQSMAKIVDGPAYLASKTAKPAAPAENAAPQESAKSEPQPERTEAKPALMAKAEPAATVLNAPTPVSNDRAAARVAPPPTMLLDSNSTAKAKQEMAELRSIPADSMRQEPVYSSPSLMTAGSGAAAMSAPMAPPVMAYQQQNAAPIITFDRGYGRRNSFTLNRAPGGIHTGAWRANAWSGTMSHTRWSTGGDGQLQRSGDGSRWQAVNVADGVVFHAVDHAGSDVWAGGSNGTLYHSHDDGETWSKVTVMASDGQILTEDITSVSFRQPGTVTIRTQSNDTWISVDGGLHWALHR